MPKNKAAQALGRLGGKKSGGMRTPAQIEARKANQLKAIEARRQKAAARRTLREN